MKSKITKASKQKTNSKKKLPGKAGIAAAGILGLAGIAGLGINRLIKKRSFGQTSTEPVNEDKKIAFYTALESDKGFKALQKALEKEQQANKKLVDHINRCNKEVLRLQGTKKEARKADTHSLRKEALLRSTIKKLQQNKK